MKPVPALAIAAALLAALAAGAGLAVVRSGAYDISATSQHLQPVYSLLATTMRQTAMPDMGVTEAHARDMAAYLATLR